MLRLVCYRKHPAVVDKPQVYLHGLHRLPIYCQVTKLMSTRHCINVLLDPELNPDVVCGHVLFGVNCNSSFVVDLNRLSHLKDILCDVMGAWKLPFMVIHWWTRRCHSCGERDLGFSSIFYTLPNLETVLLQQIESWCEDGSSSRRWDDVITNCHLMLVIMGGCECTICKLMDAEVYTLALPSLSSAALCLRQSQ